MAKLEDKFIRANEEITELNLLYENEPEISECEDTEDIGLQKKSRTKLTSIVALVVVLLLAGSILMLIKLGNNQKNVKKDEHKKVILTVKDADYAIGEVSVSFTVPENATFKEINYDSRISACCNVYLKGYDESEENIMIQIMGDYLDSNFLPSFVLQDVSIGGRDCKLVPKKRDDKNLYSYYFLIDDIWINVSGACKVEKEKSYLAVIEEIIGSLELKGIVEREPLEDDYYRYDIGDLYVSLPASMRPRFEKYTFNADEIALNPSYSTIDIVYVDTLSPYYYENITLVRIDNIEEYYPANGTQIEGDTYTGYESLTRGEYGAYCERYIKSKDSNICYVIMANTNYEELLDKGGEFYEIIESIEFK